MKVSFDLKNDRLNNRKPVSFKGYQFGKDENGFKQFEVSYPFDPEKENCYLEIYMEIMLHMTIQNGLCVAL